MNLVGDLSSARLRDELIWLFSEPEVGHTILRIGELGLNPAIHPALAADAETTALVRRADEAARRFQMLDEIKLWRLRLACLARKMDGGQLDYWMQRLKLRRLDADRIIKGVVLARQVQSRLRGQELSRAALYELLGRLPAEALLLAWAEAEDQKTRGLLELYLLELRYIDISINGNDLIKMGLKESPELGDILAQVKLMKLDGKVDGREEELKAAMRLAAAKGLPPRG
jgi:tRNA nucleotidyltransferase (CCA-adding enzyme)